MHRQIKNASKIKSKHKKRQMSLSQADSVTDLFLPFNIAMIAEDIQIEVIADKI